MATMTVAVPAGLRLLTPTLALDGPGQVSIGGLPADRARVGWRGTLAPGERVAVTFETLADFWVRDLTEIAMPYLASARADDGAGGWWGASAWLWPMPRMYYFSSVRR